MKVKFTDSDTKEVVIIEGADRGEFVDRACEEIKKRGWRRWYCEDLED